MSAGSLSKFNVKIEVKGFGEARGELIRFLAPRTVDKIISSFPLEGKASLWKDEVYFITPIKMGSEKEKSNVESGTIAYWPMGGAICIFYGKSQPYSPVNVVGKVTENLELFKSVKSGSTITVKKA
ncbi:MAG: cyclophilin-like fold protein [Candidatus Bathyarchaeota archaeon]